MPLSPYAKEQKRKIDLAIKMDEHFHDWEAEFKPELALAFVKRCEIYNSMTREGIVGLIQFINDHAPKVDDKPKHYFRIGNESSRVIYACFDTWNVNPDADWKKLAKDIEDQARNLAGCQEFTVEPDRRGLKFRIWWD